MRAVTLRLVLSLVAAIPVASGCGESSEAQLHRETLAECAPAVDAFAADVEGGRIDAAVARTTRAFQGAATPEGLRAVQDSLRRALGATRTRTPREVESVVADGVGEAAGGPPRAREAVVVVDGRYERGAAVIRARLHRDSARGGWLVDGYEVRNDLFTWTFRR